MENLLTLAVLLPLAAAFATFLLPAKKPAAIRALGSKSAARALAQSLGVPCLPGYQGADQSNERFAAEAQQLWVQLYGGEHVVGRTACAGAVGGNGAG